MQTFGSVIEIPDGNGTKFLFMVQSKDEVEARTEFSKFLANPVNLAKVVLAMRRWPDQTINHLPPVDLGPNAEEMIEDEAKLIAALRRMFGP